MQRATRRSRRSAVSLALALAATAGCTSDPVRPEDWLAAHEPPPYAPTLPPPIPMVGFAYFLRSTKAGNDILVNGYTLKANGEATLEAFHEGDAYPETYAKGDYSLTDSSAIVLRLTLAASAPDAPTGYSAGVYEVSGVLRGDTLRLAYPDSMQRMHRVFAEGDYILAVRGETRGAKMSGVQ